MFILTDPGGRPPAADELTADTLLILPQQGTGKVTVRDGIDTHLDDLRQQLSQLPQMLDRVAAELRNEAAFRPPLGESPSPKSPSQSGRYTI